MQNDLFSALNDPEEKIKELPDLVDWVSRAPTAVSHALGDNLIVEYTNLFDASLSLRAFDEIDATTQWRQDQIRIAGRTIPVPRLQCWMGAEHCRYAYSNISLEPMPWTHEMSSIRDLVNQVTGAAFNCVLINKYRSGEDSVSWHADDEPELGPSPRIASLSLGATRRFQLKRKVSPEMTSAARSERVVIALNSGSLLVMEPGVQENWVHQVAKTKIPVGPRINLTFRTIEDNR
jgi:alkylated DNA repair dioxygenase AlkB